MKQYLYVYNCVYLFMCVEVCLYMWVRVCVCHGICGRHTCMWRSDDSFGHGFLSSTVLETVSLVRCCVPQHGRPVRFYTFPPPLPSWFRSTGLPVLHCLTLSCVGSVHQMQALALVWQDLDPWNCLPSLRNIIFKVCDFLNLASLRVMWKRCITLYNMQHSS